MMLEGIIGTVFTAFVTVSVVLFIVDGIKAKRQHRKRKTGITVMFSEMLRLGPGIQSERN